MIRELILQIERLHKELEDKNENNNDVIRMKQTNQQLSKVNQSLALENSRLRFWLECEKNKSHRLSDSYVAVKNENQRLFEYNMEKDSSLTPPNSPLKSK